MWLVDWPTVESRHSKGQRVNRLGAVLIGLVLVAGGAAWGVALRNRSYDFDEVQRAHSIWMASQGLRPYEDFLECHPPYFALLSPILPAPFDAGAVLLRLRLFAAVGNLLFLGGLVAAAIRVARAGRYQAWLATTLVAFHPSVLGFLTEFRIDGWGYAIALWSIVRLAGSRRSWRYLEFGLTTGIATLLFCPKLTLLSPLVVVFEALKLRSTRDVSRVIGTYASGLVAACVAFGLYLSANGISLERTYEFLVRYHVLANAHSGFGFGLFRSVAAVPLLAIPVVAGAVAWLFGRVRARSLPDALTGAVAVWMAISLLSVSYPYKQYSAAWFLFASAVLPHLSVMASRLPRQFIAATFAALCALSVYGSIAQARSWAAVPAAQQQAAVLRSLSRASDPTDRVVATPPCHPIDRRDASFVWFNTVDPAQYGTEGILASDPKLRETVSVARYRSELSAAPPAFIVVQFWDLYPPLQRSVLERFVEERGYVPATVGNVQLAVRPDRYDRFIGVPTQ
jgi:hypothetical protein